MPTCQLSVIIIGIPVKNVKAYLSLSFNYFMLLAYIFKVVIMVLKH